MVDTEPTIAPNGGSITITTSNPDAWYKALCVVYYEEVVESDPDTDSNWVHHKNNKDQVTETEIKFSNRKKDCAISITIKLYHTTGTILVQGATKSIERWHAHHYPGIQKLVEANMSQAHGSSVATENEKAREDESLSRKTCCQRNSLKLLYLEMKMEKLNTSR